MKIFDHTFADEVATRLESLPEDVQPQWGTMNRGQLFGHLHLVLRYTLGEGPEMPYKGNFKSRYIFRNIIMLGLKEIPHNIRVPRPKELTREQVFAESTPDVLTATMSDYLGQADKGALPARTHPYFGTLTGTEWQRFHRLHFIHHLKQFGVGTGL